jgi:hypothetical protein
MSPDTLADLGAFIPRRITEDRSMKRKMFALVLVVVCLSVLVVEGVSQPSSQPSFPPAPLQSPSTLAPVPPNPPAFESKPAANFSAVQPQQQEWTFEQLVEALKGVRARQKELHAQEADLLAKMAKKVEEKRQDLSKSEATLQQLRSENGRIYPAPRLDELKTEEKKK